MVLPVSINIQLKRLDSYLRHLRKEEDKEEQSVLVAEICNSCILLLDKTMNKIWDAKSNRSSRKPHIYFPVCSSREKLLAKFQQYQLSNIASTDSKIFSIIESSQSYSGDDWLSKLHKIAAIRHESFPEVENITRSGFGIGFSQDLYIERLTTDEGGNIIFRGHGINRESGNREPPVVHLLNEVTPVLKEAGKAPYDFCFDCVNKSKKIISSIYMLVDK